MRCKKKGPKVSFYTEKLALWISIIFQMVITYYLKFFWDHQKFRYLTHKSKYLPKTKKTVFQKVRFFDVSGRKINLTNNDMLDVFYTSTLGFKIDIHSFSQHQNIKIGQIGTSIIKWRLAIFGRFPKTNVLLARCRCVMRVNPASRRCGIWLSTIVS